MSDAEIQDSLTFAPRQTFKGHTDSVSGVIHLLDGQRIITSSQDGSLRLWNMESGLQIGEDWRDGDSPVRAIALSPDGKQVASGSDDGAVRLWGIDTRKVIATGTGHTYAVQYVCWSGDGRRVVSRCRGDGTAREWDVESGESILGPFKMSDFMFAFAYSPEKDMIAIAGIRLQEMSTAPEDVWDVRTRQLVTTLKGHTPTSKSPKREHMNASCLTWTADGKKLLAGSLDGTIRTWDTTTWEEIAVFPVGLSVDAMAVSPNSRVLAIAACNGGLLLNLENGNPIVGQLKVPTTSVSFSADGKLQFDGYGARDRDEPDPDDYHASTFDVAAILKAVGLDGLLLDATVSCSHPSVHHSSSFKN
jgi:WD40 repeat protein